MDSHPVEDKQLVNIDIDLPTLSALPIISVNSALPIVTPFVTAPIQGEAARISSIMPAQTPDEGLPLLDPYESCSNSCERRAQKAFRLAQVDQVKDWLLTAWDLNIDSDTVQQALINTGWIQPEGFGFSDVTGDGRSEWLISLSHGEPYKTVLYHGDFLIVGEGGIFFEFYNSAEYLSDIPVSLYQPQIVEVADFTQDDVDDILLHSVTCGAHTCWSYFYMMSAHYGGFQNLVIHPVRNKFYGRYFVHYHNGVARERYLPVSMSYASFEVLDATNDGYVDLILKGGGHVHVGAGIPRRREEVWGWDGERFALVRYQWLESEYRFHLLYEANDELYKGDIGAARELYQIVVEDDNLMANPAAFRPMDDDIRLKRYAAARLAQIAYWSNDFEELVYWRDWLFSENANSVFAQVGQIFYEAHLQGDSGDTVCRKIDLLFQSYSAFDLVDLEVPGDAGYANPGIERFPVDCLLPKF